MKRVIFDEDDKDTIFALCIVIFGLFYRVCQVINAVATPVCLIWVVNHICNFGWRS